MTNKNKKIHKNLEHIETFMTKCLPAQPPFSTTPLPKGIQGVSEIRVLILPNNWDIDRCEVCTTRLHNLINVAVTVKMSCFSLASVAKLNDAYVP
jgi:hypothetical protein